MSRRISQAPPPTISVENQDAPKQSDINDRYFDLISKALKYSTFSTEEQLNFVNELADLKNQVKYLIEDRDAQGWNEETAKAE